MILVTGGAGSIGSEVVRHLVANGESVRVMDINEEGLWALRAELPQIEVVLQSVTVAASVPGDVSAIIYCAACKHVDLCETGDREWIDSVNIRGAMALSKCMWQSGGQFVYLSTDKAIRPSSAMGCSKFEGERAVIHHGGNVVRFGNVIGTRGSLVPMVRRCAELGRPIPLTDPEMTRWMMPVAEAVDLILRALVRRDGGRILSPVKPRAVNIRDFMEACRNQFAPDCPIEHVGVRPGERLHEPMELVDGTIAWSNDPRFAMSKGDMLRMIAATVKTSCSSGAASASGAPSRILETSCH